MQTLFFQHLFKILIIAGRIADNAQVVSHFQNVFYRLKCVGFMIENFGILFSEHPGKRCEGI